MAVLKPINHNIGVNNMTKTLNIRQVLNATVAQEVSDDLLLVQQGIVSMNGNLTALGRRVQADLVFRGQDASKAGLANAIREALEVEVEEDTQA